MTPLGRQKNLIYWLVSVAVQAGLRIGHKPQRPVLMCRGPFQDTTEIMYSPLKVLCTNYQLEL